MKNKMNRLNRQLTIDALVFLLSTTPASCTAQDLNQLERNQVQYEQSIQSQTPKERQSVVVFSGHTKSLRTKTDGQGTVSASGINEYLFNDELVRLFSEVRNPAFSYIPVLA